MNNVCPRDLLLAQFYKEPVWHYVTLQQYNSMWLGYAKIPIEFIWTGRVSYSTLHCDFFVFSEFSKSKETIV